VDTVKIYGIRNCDAMKKAARALALLEEFPSAIRRPVLEAGGKLLVGFDPAEYARL
jgi:arsenate reductase-like glutaredoxin family protein